jgi:hypothetical protein
MSLASWKKGQLLKLSDGYFCLKVKSILRSDRQYLYFISLSLILSSLNHVMGFSTLQRRTVTSNKKRMKNFSE